MEDRPPRLRALVSWLLPVALSVAATPATAETIVLRPGAGGEDTAPYEFIASLARGGLHTLYAFDDQTNEDPHDFETFLRFDLSGIDLGPEEEVVEAYLTMYYAIDSSIFGEGSDEPGIAECRPVTSSWSEMDVNWENRPSHGPPVDTVTGITSLGTLIFEVTGLVGEWLAGARPNYGFAITNPTERLLGFNSWEAPVADNLKASLVIVIEAPEPGGAEGAASAALALGLLAGARRRRSGGGTP
jgi:hypothetical protein